jgi:hypothetical protein
MSHNNNMLHVAHAPLNAMSEPRSLTGGDASSRAVYALALMLANFGTVVSYT